MINLTKSENLVIAKRTVIKNIFHSAVLEGLDITLNQTKRIIENHLLEDIRSRELREILNLKDAWNFLFKSLEDDVDLHLILKYHMYIGRIETLELKQIGAIRTCDVRVSGTNWQPIIPKKNILELEMTRILENKDAKEKAVELFLWIMRSQIFQDGNKRVAHLIANHVLISSAKGILTIKPELLPEFITKLITFYETNDNLEIKRFILFNCIYKDESNV